MKVGVLTYHRVVNLGSVVQTWATVQIARMLFPGARVEVVDYRPLRMEWREVRKLVRLRPPSVNVRQIQKLRSLRSFLRRTVTLSNESIRTNCTEKAKRWLLRQGYDVILVGSDTVWELRQGAYSPEGVNLYFLPGNLGARKISIAASMDPVGILNPVQESLMRSRISSLRDFDLLTVRDVVTQRVLTNNGIPSSHVIRVPDPTVIVGIDPLCTANPPFDSGDRPVAGVSLPRHLAEYAHRNLSMLGYDVWDWNGVVSPFVNRALPGTVTPEQLLALHRECDVFITDRFHASIFCLSQQVAPVVFYEDPRKWPIPNSKGRDLFATLGLEDFVVREIDRIADKNSLEELLLRDVQGRKIEHRIEEVGKESRAILLDSIRPLFGNL